MLEAERWGDEGCRSAPRRLIDAAFLRAPQRWRATSATPSLPLPTAVISPVTAADGAPDGAQEPRRRRERARGPGGAAAVARPHRRGIGDGLLGGEHPERGRPADRLLAATADDIGDVRPLIEGAPLRAARRLLPAAGRRGSRGTLPADWLPAPAAPRARAAARPSARPRSSVSSAASASASRVPSGAARSKSSSSAGIRTKRRPSTCSCGSVIRSSSKLELAEQQDVDVDRRAGRAGPPARRVRARARCAWRCRAARAARASVSDEQAGVEEARLVEHLADGVGVVNARDGRRQHALGGQRVDGACRFARRSPTFDPSPSSARRISLAR